MDLGTTILQYSRDRSKGGEGVSRSLTFGLGDLRQESRLSDGREANQCDSCITTFADIEASTTTGASAACRLEELGSKAGEFSDFLLAFMSSARLGQSRGFTLSTDQGDTLQNVRAKYRRY